MAPHVSCCMDTLHLLRDSLVLRRPNAMNISLSLSPSLLSLLLSPSHKKGSAMALLLLHALLLASATAAVAMDNATGDGSATSPVLCNGAGCQPPPQPLPIYGYPPPAPSLPSVPPAPPSSPGSQTPCPPVPVVCCGAGGQYMPQQPNYYAPPTGYLPYYNASNSPPLLLAHVTAAYYVMVACVFLLWAVV